MTEAAALLAEKYKKKIFMTGQTIGPLDRADMVRLKPVFGKMDYIDLRDHSCESWLRSCTGSVQVSGDDVLLGLLPESVDIKDAQIASLAERPHMNLCFQEWELTEESGEAYLRAKRETAKFVNWYCERNQEVSVYILEFMPLDHDMRCGKEIASFFNENIKVRCYYLCMASPKFLWEGVLAILQSARLNIGTRYHMALFSMTGKIPAWSVVLDDYYEIKLRQIHALFGSAGCMTLEECTCDRMKQLLENESVEKPEIQEELAVLKQAKIDHVKKLIGAEKRKRTESFWKHLK